jgi:hypothetical protein
MKFRLFRHIAVATALFSIVVAGSAQDAPPPLPGTLIIEGMSAPRGVAFDGFGNLIVVEAGSGGDTSMEVPSLEDSTVMATILYGLTGSVQVVSEESGAVPWVVGLPSYAGPTETTGVYRAIPHENSLWLVVTSNGQGGGYWGSSVVELDGASLMTKNVINLTSYEVANNPDGNEIDSNVADIAWGADGTLYIVDAGANTLYTWSLAEGLTVVNAWPENSVPDAIEVAENGDIYIGFLGVGIAPGAAKIEHWSGGELVNTISGLNGITDILLDGDTLYAVELANFAEGPISGRVLQIAADGTVTPLATNLNAPFGIAKDADGALYVSIGTLFFGPDLPSGILKLDMP